MAEQKVFELPNAVNVDGLWMPETAFHGNLLNEGCRMDDVVLHREETVLLASYPKTGTTWLSQIVTLLMAGEERYDVTKNTTIAKRVPYLELKVPGMMGIDDLENCPCPRLVSSHLPYRLIHKWITRDNLKTIVAFRNPKDTMVSNYHFYRMHEGFGPYKGDWDGYFEHVRAGKQFNGNHIDWMLEWWKNKSNGNLLFVKYEDMILNLETEVRRLAAFLEVDLSDLLLQKILKDSTFKSMQRDPNTNYSYLPYMHQDISKFIRKGEIGDWKNYFTIAQNEWFDEKYLDCLHDSGIDLIYENDKA